MNLLLTGAFQYSKEQLAELKTLFDNVFFIEDERIPLHEQEIDFDVSEIHAIVCNALFLHNDVSRFSSLRFVQLTSAGFDRVPVEEMKSRGIRVENARGVYSVPMAEWAVLKVLELYKYSRFFYKAQEQGLWKKNRDVLELSGKVVAVFGLGSVGIETAMRLKAFGCHLIGVDPYIQAGEYLDEFYGLEDIETILRRSDIVILALPLNDGTRHFIDGRKIALMKDSAVLINVARGELIDETALIAALDDGKFLGVALDVFEEEPLPKSSPLWSMENVIITPHNSFVSDRVDMKFFDLIRRNIIDHLASCR